MAAAGSPTRFVVGVMTGTSIDGIDAALVRIEGSGLEMRASLVQHVSESLGGLQPRLRAAASQQPMTAGELAQLARDFGARHADVISRLTSERPDLICVHGQTIFHQPPVSWQLVNPATIAARFHCPIVSDLRQADLAHGGQGAPITPIADWILFRDDTRSRAIINLGGFCNVTILPRQRAATSSAPAADSLLAVGGFDVCACNQLLDAIARQTLNAPFDADGDAARSGQASQPATQALLGILEQQRSGRRSLGTGDEALRWIDDHRSSLAANDLAASGVQAIAQTIIASLHEHAPDELILAGGGARNRALRTALETVTDAFSGAVRTTEDFSVPLESREAMCFAVLGALCQDRVPITLPQVTGCSTPAPLSGVWTHT